jgi:hypothetical protein
MIAGVAALFFHTSRRTLIDHHARAGAVPVGGPTVSLAAVGM